MDLSEYVVRHTRPVAPPLVPELRLCTAERITPLWEGLEALAGKIVPPPFWAFPWVGGQALARYVLDHPGLVRGRAVLDFGAGSGIVGIAALAAGATRVVATEIDPLAAAAVGVNARLNGVTVETLVADVIGTPQPDVDVIFAGDVCYEDALAARALAWLRGLAAQGRTVLLGDPGRTYAPKDGIERLAEYAVPTTRELEDREIRQTAVLRLLGTM